MPIVLGFSLIRQPWTPACVGPRSTEPTEAREVLRDRAFVLGKGGGPTLKRVPHQVKTIVPRKGYIRFHLSFAGG